MFVLEDGSLVSEGHDPRAVAILVSGGHLGEVNKILMPAGIVLGVCDGNVVVVEQLRVVKRKSGGVTIGVSAVVPETAGVEYGHLVDGVIRIPCGYMNVGDTIDDDGDPCFVFAYPGRPDLVKYMVRQMDMDKVVLG